MRWSASAPPSSFDPPPQQDEGLRSSALRGQRRPKAARTRPCEGDTLDLLNSLNGIQTLPIDTAGGTAADVLELLGSVHGTCERQVPDDRRARGASGLGEVW